MEFLKSYKDVRVKKCITLFGEYVENLNHTGRFIMLSMITNIYNKKTPNAYAEPSTLLFSTSIAP
jgi:hypothetical protein